MSILIVRVVQSFGCLNRSAHVELLDFFSEFTSPERMQISTYVDA